MAGAPLGPFPPAVLAAALLLLAQGALGAAALPGPACPPPPEVALARDVLQNDAGAGVDAGDCAAAALAVVLDDDGYRWGFLDAPGGPALTDLEDWFVVDLARDLGAGSRVEVQVTPNLVSSFVPAGAYLHAPFFLALYPPGAEAPLLTIDSCGEPAVFQNAPGLWRVRLYQLPLPDAPLCAASQYYPVAVPPLDAVGQTYGFYMGCKPLCVFTQG